MRRTLGPLLIVASCGAPRGPDASPVPTHTDGSAAAVPGAPPPRALPTRPPTSDTPRPDLEILLGAPADLATRSAELLGVTCPSGTKVHEWIVHTAPAYRVRRQCERPDGVIEGPIVEFSTDGVRAGLSRRGEHLGRRHGTFVEVGGATTRELTYDTGVPVGAYRVRTRTGVVLAEGTFDERGRVDGEWTFRGADGTELARSRLAHGTGTFELWDVTGGGAPLKLYRASCTSGLFDGAVEYRQGGTSADSGRIITATFDDGLPHGEWTAMRARDGAILQRGRYVRGVPTGTWHLLAEDVCLYEELHGDVIDCAKELHDVPYTCQTGTACAFDRLADGPTPGRATSRDTLRPPEAHTRPRRCELPDQFFVTR